MADPFGTVTGVIGLAQTVLQVMQQIRKTKAQIRGRPQTLSAVSQQIDNIFETVTLIAEEENLHTANVQQQLFALTGVADELRAYFDKLSTEQHEGRVRQFFHALKSADDEDQELVAISGRLDDARSELLVRISVAQVGLIGDLHAGFSVAVDVLMGTNSKCKRVLGEDLQLARKLKGRQPDGNRINLKPKDMEALGLQTEGLRDRTPDTKRDPVEVTFVENVTLDQARIMFGIVGVQDWQRAAGVKANVRGNQFGNEMKFFAGIADASVAKAVFA